MRWLPRDIPLLPPCPAGAAMLEQMRAGLEQEGNQHGLDLLQACAQMGQE